MTQAPKVYDIPEDAVYKPCRACQTPITFVQTENGKQMPVTKDGVSHYASCTQPKRFSGKGKAADSENPNYYPPGPKGT